MAPRTNLKDQDRKRPYKPRGSYTAKGNQTGPRPNVWKAGPDPRRHEQYTAWLKHRSQAAFRGESYELTFEQWETLWNTDWAWENRGRTPQSVNLTRIDKERGWYMANVVIITRIEYLREMAKSRTGTKYKTGGKT